MAWKELSRLWAASFLVLLACNDVEVDSTYPPAEDTTGTIAGRVCSPDGDGWLEDAWVYTNIVDDGGVIRGIRETYTDRDGYFVLGRVPAADQVTVYIQKGTYQDTIEATVRKGSLTSLPEPVCRDPLSISALVVLGEYDTFSRMLDEIGVTTYSTVDGTDPDALYALLSNEEAMLGFDIVCVNGGIQEEGVVDDPLVATNVSAYVEAGGTLFVTDWSYDLVERSFPEAIDFLGDDLTLSAAERGVAETISDALVVDQSLAGYLGKQTVEVRYDLAYWPLLEGASGQVVVHITGDAHYTEDGSSEPVAAQGVPLLVSFAAGYGTVVFSTFREEANLTSDMAEILQYMLYSL